MQLSFHEDYNQSEIKISALTGRFFEGSAMTENYEFRANSLTKGRKWHLFGNQFFGVGVLSAVLIWLVIVPLTMVFWGSFRTGPPGVPGGYTITNYIRAFKNASLLNSCKNTLIFAIGASLISFAGGTFLAWITERTDMPFRKGIYAIVLFPIVCPAVLFATSWLFLLNPTIGIINKAAILWLGFEKPIVNSYSMGAMIWTQGVDTFSLPFLLMAAAFRQMDPSLEEAAQAAGASLMRTVRTVTLPLLVPSALASILITFVRSIETFEVPAVMGIPAGISMFATEVWMAISRTKPADFNLAATFATGYLFVCIGGLYLYHKATGMSEKYVTVTGKGYRPTRIKLGAWRWPTAFICFILLSVTTLLPVLVFIWTSLMPYYSVPSWDAVSRITLKNYRYILSLRSTYEALYNNILVGVASAGAGVLLASIISWVVIRTRLRGRHLLDMFSFAPIAVPGTVMGLALLWLYLTVPIPIYGTLWILIVAFVSKYMTYAVRSTHSSLVQIHPELEEASSATGASWVYTFTRVTLPLIVPGLLIGFLFIFSLCFRVLGLPIMLSHTNTRLMPMLIFDLYQNGGYEWLCALGVLMMLLLVTLSAISWFVSKKFGIREAE